LNLPDAITGKLLRIFVDEDDRLHGKPLYAAIVEALKAAGFTGATVLKGIEGFGNRKTVHSARAFDFSTNMPVLIEVFEREEKVLEFIPALREMIQEGLVTLENVQIVRLSKDDA
jgi:PII-like signaling protein